MTDALSSTSPVDFPRLNIFKAWLNLAQATLTLLTIVVVVPVIVIEIRFYGSSPPAPNFTLFVALFTCWIPLLLVIFPYLYQVRNKCKSIGKFCMKSRTQLIFSGFCSALWASAGSAITAHSQDARQCQPDTTTTESLGSAYTGPWEAQCNCAKATAGFTWSTCILWLAYFACTLFMFWKKRQHIQRHLQEYKRNNLEQHHSVSITLDQPSHTVEESNKCEVGVDMPVHNINPSPSPAAFQGPSYTHNYHGNDGPASTMLMPIPSHYRASSSAPTHSL